MFDKLKLNLEGKTEEKNKNRIPSFASVVDSLGAEYRLNASGRRAARLGSQGRHLDAKVKIFRNTPAAFASQAKRN